MAKDKITGKTETDTGRNIQFEINNNKVVGLQQVKDAIQAGKLPDYEWVRPNDGRQPFPRAKPNRTTRDNIDEQKNM